MRDGAFRIDAKMTKADGAKVRAVLEPLMEIEFTNARRQGRRESPDAYRADALVALAERGSLGSGRRSRTSAARRSDEGTEPIAADVVDAPLRDRGFAACMERWPTSPAALEEK